MAVLDQDSGFLVLYDVVKLNDTLIQRYDFSFYDSNQTLSNSTTCYYIPRPAPGDLPINIYKNGTIRPLPRSCSDPVHAIRLHGILGVIMGCLFVFALLLTLMNLREVNYRRRRVASAKEGKIRYYITLLTTIAGLITCFISIDVDRVVVPGLTFELQSIFYTFLQPLLLMSLFESVRYWNWYYKSIYETNMMFSRPKNRTDDPIAMLFYVLNLAGFCLVVARDWTAISKQWYLEQTQDTARGAATDNRMQAGFLIMSACILIIFARLMVLWKSCRTQEPGRPDIYDWGKAVYLTLATAFSTVAVVYNVVSSFMWKTSPFNALVSQAYFYGYGVCPVLAALISMNVIVQHSSTRGTTRISGHAALTKPSWWRETKFPAPNNAIELSRLNSIRGIRGREEKYKDAGRSWWWQKDEEESQKAEDQDRKKSLLLHLHRDDQDQVQAPAQHSHLQDSNAPTAGGSSSSPLPSQSDQRLRIQRKQGPIKSMLDIE